MINPVSQNTTRPMIDGMIKQPNELASEVGDKGVLNTALIEAAQAVEHYVIARYGALASPSARSIARAPRASARCTTVSSVRKTPSCGDTSGGISFCRAPALAPCA